MESGRECSIPQSSVIYSRPSDSKMSTRFCQYEVVLAREQASFWRENVIAVVILRRILGRM